MSKSINTKGMTEQEWLDQRRNSIGGSEAAALLGKSKWKDPYDVYLSKIGEDEDFTGNKHTRYGHLMEPVIADVFEEESGCKVRNCHRMVIDGKHNHIHANIDRQIVSHGPESSTGILECKATQPHVEQDWIYNIDPSWYIQLQHYIMLFGYDYGYIAWESDRDFKYMRFDADPELHEHMQSEYDKFWEDHVIPQKPPEPKEEGEMDEFLEPIEGKVKDVDDDIFDLYLEMMKISGERKALKKKEKEIKKSIKAIADDAEKLTYGDQIIATRSSQTRHYPKNVDELKEEHPEIFEKYITETSFTTTRFRKP